MPFASTPCHWFNPEASESSLDCIDSGQEDKEDIVDSDRIDSDIEIALYSQLHYDTNESTPHLTTSSQDNNVGFSGSFNHFNNKDSEPKSLSDPEIETDTKTAVESVNTEDTDQPEGVNEPPIKKLKSSDLSTNQKEGFVDVSSEVSFIDLTANSQETSTQNGCETEVLSNSDSSDSSVLILSDTERDFKFNVCKGSLRNLPSPQNAEKSEKPELWKVDFEDRHGKFSGRNRYFSENKGYSENKGFFCVNCRRRGHLSKECREERKVLRCFLCGEEGHHGNRCKYPICVRCQGIGHPMEFCHLSQEIFLQRCPICEVPGHLREECPDHWRRYHLTTGGKKIVKAPKDAAKNTRVYCYNCAQKGHYGFECRRPRMDNTSFPANPQVISYVEPSAPFHAHYNGKSRGAWLKNEAEYQQLSQQKFISLMVSNENFRVYRGCLQNSSAQNLLMHPTGILNRVSTRKLQKRLAKQKVKEVTAMLKVHQQWEIERQQIEMQDGSLNEKRQTLAKQLKLQKKKEAQLMRKMRNRERRLKRRQEKKNSALPNTGQDGQLNCSVNSTRSNKQAQNKSRTPNTTNEDKVNMSGTPQQGHSSKKKRKRGRKKKTLNVLPGENGKNDTSVNNGETPMKNGTEKQTDSKAKSWWHRQKMQQHHSKQRTAEVPALGALFPNQLHVN